MTKITYKAFDENMKCRGFQFEVGKTYHHDGDVEVCESGFHSCEYPLDCFLYYAPATSNLCVVEASGAISTHDDNSKIASGTLNVLRKVELAEFVSLSVAYILGQVKETTDESGDYSAATNTGYQSAATNTGYQSAATNTGYQSAATNTGNRSAATNTGYQSAATNTGNRSAATNTGECSAATNTGNQSAATNTGNRSAATNTGYQSAATNTGYQSAATNTGECSAASVEGKNSVALNTGLGGKVKGCNGSVIALAHYDIAGSLLALKTAMVGKRGIKPDVWYKLNEAGKFVEV